MELAAIFDIVGDETLLQVLREGTEFPRQRQRNFEMRTNPIECRSPIEFTAGNPWLKRLRASDFEISQALWRPAVVNFNETVPSAVVQSSEQGGVRTRRQRRRDARLQCVCRCETRSSEFRRLSRDILPVVIRGQDRSVTVS